jgi:hypothetical protein
VLQRQGKRRPCLAECLARLRPTLTRRRERTREGYGLRYFGRDASSPLLDEVIDKIERMYGSGKPKIASVCRIFT